MKLTKEQAKQIIAKVHIDLNLDHNDKYPILANFISKDDKYNDIGIDNWGGGYDYRNPIGNDGWGTYTEWLVIIDDEKGEAISFHYYTGHYQIRLNKEGKYEIIKQMYRNK